MVTHDVIEDPLRWISRLVDAGGLAHTQRAGGRRANRWFAKSRVHRTTCRSQVADSDSPSGTLDRNSRHPLICFVARFILTGSRDPESTKNSAEVLRVICRRTRNRLRRTPRLATSDFGMRSSNLRGPLTHKRAAAPLGTTALQTRRGYPPPPRLRRGVRRSAPESIAREGRKSPGATTQSDPGSGSRIPDPGTRRRSTRYPRPS
jgi:hypothetical protein